MQGRGEEDKEGGGGGGGGGGWWGGGGGGGRRHACSLGEILNFYEGLYRTFLAF